MEKGKQTLEVSSTLFYPNVCQHVYRPNLHLICQAPTCNFEGCIIGMMSFSLKITEKTLNKMAWKIAVKLKGINPIKQEYNQQK